MARDTLIDCVCMCSKKKNRKRFIRIILKHQRCYQKTESISVDTVKRWYIHLLVFIVNVLPREPVGGMQSTLHLHVIQEADVFPTDDACGALDWTVFLYIENIKSL